MLHKGLLLPFCCCFLSLNAVAFYRKDEGLKQRLDKALEGRDQGSAAAKLAQVFERSDFGSTGSINVMLLGVDGRAAAKAFLGPSTICYDLTNTSLPDKRSEDIMADMSRLTSRCQLPCEPVVIIEHAQMLKSGQALNPLLPIIDDKGLEATFLVLYETDGWRVPGEGRGAKQEMRNRLKAEWMNDQFNSDAFLGRFEVVAFEPTRRGVPGDLGPLCSGSKDVDKSWHPEKVVGTVVVGFVVLAIMHWSFSFLSAKKCGAEAPLFPPGGQGPPPPRGPARKAPTSPVVDVEVPASQPRGGGARRASAGSAHSSSGESAGAEVRRSSRLKSKKS